MVVLALVLAGGTLVVSLVSAHPKVSLTFVEYRGWQSVAVLRHRVRYPSELEPFGALRKVGS